MLKKIISSGETGAARGALEAAIRLGIPRGGWTIQGQTRDPLLPAGHLLEEIAGDRWIDADRQNIFDTDGTLVLSRGGMSPRIEQIRDMADTMARPWLHIDLMATGAFEAARALNGWVIENRIGNLNVTGPRASRDPEMQRAAADLLEAFYYLHLMNPETAGVDAPGPGPVPRRVEEAVSLLMRRMPLKDRTTLANMTAGELPALEPTLGGYIRSTFELDSGNTPLLESCRWVSKDMKMEPDKGPAVIIRKLWEELRQTHTLRIVK